MAPPSLWTGNLRLSLVIIPVKLSPAITNEEVVSFRMIHEPSGKPIRYVKGVRDGDDFVEVPEEEIVKGYEHAKGHHVLIDPKELDDLKLEAKHTIDIVRFVDKTEIDSRYWEKPYRYPGCVEADRQGRYRPAHHAWPRAPSWHQGPRAWPHAFDIALRERSPRRRALLRQTHPEARQRGSGLGKRADQANERTL
jgi:hypothetical protein